MKRDNFTSYALEIKILFQENNLLCSLKTCREEKRGQRNEKQKGNGNVEKWGDI